MFLPLENEYSTAKIVYTYSTAAWTRPQYVVFVPLSPASTEFRKIPQKHRNSAEMGKFRGSDQNSVLRGKLWTLVTLFNSAWKYYSYNHH